MSISVVFKHWCAFLIDDCTTILNILTTTQDFGDGIGGTVYKQKLDVFVRYLNNKSPEHLNDVAKLHDICDILTQVRSEYAETEENSTNSETQEWLEVTAASDDGHKDSPLAQMRLYESTDATEEQHRSQKGFWPIRTTLNMTWNSKDCDCGETKPLESGIWREIETRSSGTRPKSGWSRLFKR